MLLAACLLGWYYQTNHAQTGHLARIYQNGILVQEIDLSSVTETYQLRFEGENGSYNIVEIRPQEIGIVEASCPDKICIHTGFIHTNLIPITCLPNHLVIQIESDENTQLDLDGVAF
ncbi:MAG: NusG domain II-containing protein [Lachnospiraceae bacterium]